jgi:hypothetical protein
MDKLLDVSKEALSNAAASQVTEQYIDDAPKTEPLSDELKH